MDSLRLLLYLIIGALAAIIVFTESEAYATNEDATLPWAVSTFRTENDRVQCWIYAAPYKGGISCLPVSSFAPRTTP